MSEEKVIQKKHDPDVVLNREQIKREQDLKILLAGRFWEERSCRSVAIFQPAKYLADSSRGLTTERWLDFLLGDGSLIEVFDQNVAIVDDFFFGPLAVAGYL